MAVATPKRKRAARAGLFARSAPEKGPVVLNRRRIYILPTRAGLVFAAILLAMLIGAINYANSLAFLLTFLLGSLATVSIIHSFRNLNGLVFRPGHPQAVFAGGDAIYPVAIENLRDSPRFAIQLSLPNQPARQLDIDANSVAWVDLHLPALRRGKLAFPRATVFTRFPLGLFHAWGYVHLDMECVVYPRPAPRQELPRDLLARSGQGGEQGDGGDDFANLRAYRPGDSLRHIHWKALARGHELLTKQFGEEQSDELWLEWEKAVGRDSEERLAVLCRWVLEAEEQRFRYGMALPGIRIEIDQGPAQRHRCLAALASFGEAK